MRWLRNDTPPYCIALSSQTLTSKPICMYVYMCMNVCVYVCMFVCMHVFMYMCVCMYVCIHVCMHACLCVCMHIHIGMYVCMSMYVRMKLYVYNVIRFCKLRYSIQQYRVHLGKNTQLIDGTLFLQVPRNTI